MDTWNQLARQRAENTWKYRYSTPLPFVEPLIHGKARPSVGTDQKPPASSNSDESQEGLVSDSNNSPLSQASTSATTYAESPMRSVDGQKDADSDQCQPSSSSGRDSGGVSSDSGTHQETKSEPSSDSTNPTTACISSDSSNDATKSTVVTPSPTSTSPTNYSDSPESSIDIARPALPTKHAPFHPSMEIQGAQSREPTNRRRVFFEASVQDVTQTQHHRQLAQSRKVLFEQAERARPESRGQSERLKAYDGPRRCFRQTTSETQHQAQKPAQAQIRDGVPHLMTRESDVLVETVEGVSLTTDHDTSSSQEGSVPIPEIEARDVQNIEPPAGHYLNSLEAEFEHYNRQYSRSLPPASHASQNEGGELHSAPARPNKQDKENPFWTKKGWKERTKQLLAGPLYQPDDEPSVDGHWDPVAVGQQPREDVMGHWTADDESKSRESIRVRSRSLHSEDSAAPAPCVPLRRK